MELDFHSPNKFMACAGGKFSFYFTLNVVFSTCSGQSIVGLCELLDSDGDVEGFSVPGYDVVQTGTKASISAEHAASNFEVAFLPETSFPGVVPQETGKYLFEVI